MSAITGAVPIDEHRLNDALRAISREFDGRLNAMHTMLTNDAVTRETNAVDRENRLLQHITALIASNVGTIVALSLIHI